MTVNVKQAACRKVHYHTLDDILADAEAIAAQPHRTTGNHSVGELFYHVAVPIDKAVTGFDFTAPLPMKIFGRVLKQFGVERPIKPGIHPPKTILPYFWPAQDIAVDEGLAYLRCAIEAARAPGSMTHPSPLFGQLTHDQWVQVNCRHAELHFSFIQLDTD